jgi:hypothetical protein
MGGSYFDHIGNYIRPPVGYVVSGFSFLGGSCTFVGTHFVFSIRFISIPP